MATKGFLSSLFGKGDGNNAGDQKSTERLTQELLQKLIRGNSGDASIILQETKWGDETRAKLIAFCDGLANAGLKPARTALALALKHSLVFHENEETALPHIKMTVVQQGDTTSEICKRVRSAMPCQVFVTGGGIFTEVAKAEKEIRESLGAQYNIRLLNTGSRALIRHSLIALKREVQADPGQRNLIIGVYPSPSWASFLRFPPSVYNPFSPWPQQEFSAAVFLIGTVSYPFVLEAASLINGADKASGIFENLVPTGDPRLTNREYDQIQSATSSEEQSALLLQVSKDIQKSYETMGTSGMAYTGPSEALDVVKHEAFGDMFLSRGMYQKAITELETATALERDRRILADLFINLALCHAQLGRFSNAGSILKSASGANPALVAEAQQIVEQLRRAID